MRRSKLIGKVYDGRWEIIDTIQKSAKHISYIARNIFNNKEIEVSDKQMTLLEKGKIDFGCIIRRKMYLDGKYNCLTFRF